MAYIINWIDLIWVFVALVVLHKGQRMKAVMFILSCVLALRLQVELMFEIGYPTGFFPLLEFPLLERGFMAYSVFIATFLALSYFSRERDTYIYMAASITVFITAFCVSTLVMVL